MEMLDGTGFNAHSRTQDEQQLHLVFVEIDTNVRDWFDENTL